MTKEPIMIDDVDVSECEYWNGSELGYCNIGLWANDGTHICECEPNCYYKQLKRKEQELNQYRPIIDRLLKQFETYDKLKSFDVVTFAKQTFEQLEQLKSENEELKFQNKRLDEVATYWHKSIFKVERNERNLKQALQEIKGTLEQYLDADKRIDKEADVDVYLMAMQKWLNKCEVKE